MVTPLGWLTDLPTFKEKVRQQPDNVNYGLVGYPVLMACRHRPLQGRPRAGGRSTRPRTLSSPARSCARFNYRFGTNVLVEPGMKVTEFPR